MRSEKKRTASRRVASPKAKAKANGRGARTKALAVREAIRREPVRQANLMSPLAALMPLQRAVLDRQIAILGAAMAWSPAQVLVDHQAAFWTGFNAEGSRGPRARQPRRRSIRRK